MAEKQTNKDRMREIVDSIENGIKELFESDKYRQYLSTMSRFHRYSVNNLKQMAQTVAYLQDHELLDYAILSEKAAAASAHFNELSARIKSAETRMAEIAVLREHIVGYAKTRDTYVAYRKAGYSKKFLVEHESEITIHKAAKNYFDGLGFKKLPTIKALNTEYAELLAEKKAAYADYRKAREEMKELLTAKANIDRILELDKEQEEANERREKEAEQR